MKVLVIADIHGNAEALRAVLERERDADRTVFLGDAVLSGPQANETAALLEGRPGAFIAGNHDDEVFDRTRYAHFPQEWVALNDAILDGFDGAGYRLLRSFGPAGVYREGGVTMYLHHGTVPGGLRHALPDTPDAALASLAGGDGSEHVLFGHSHVQFSRTIGAQTFINPGSVGQPRCGRLHACYGVFEDGVYHPRHVQYDPGPWLDALQRIDALDRYPKFRHWLKQGLLTGYGIGAREPWTTFARQGYR